MPLNLIIDTETDETFYDSVRRLLGGVSEIDLPNEDILDPTIFDVSELEILELVPCLDDGELTDAELTKVRLALIHLIASKLCPTMMGRIDYEVKTIDVSWKRKPIDYEDLKNNLLSIVDTLLQGIQCYGVDKDSPIFRVAPSKRKVNESEKL